MNALQRIIDWLRQPTNEYVRDEEGLSRYVRFQDSPWMDFSAEWQDWSFAGPGAAQLHIGYHQEINGDLVGDPIIVFDLIGDVPQRIIWETMVGPLDGTNEPYEHMLSVFWERHFATRPLSPREAGKN